MPKITPFLWFDTNAEEAMNFYISVFKNSKVVNVSRYTEVGPGPKGAFMVGSFEIEGMTFTVLNGGPAHAKFDLGISFVINCETQDEIDYYWEALGSNGGETNVCGWLKDKFGLAWQVTPAHFGRWVNPSEPERANRVMAAMMHMKKLDIAALQAAYDGR